MCCQLAVANFCTQQREKNVKMCPNIGEQRAGVAVDKKLDQTRRKKKRTVDKLDLQIPCFAII